MKQTFFYSIQNWEYPQDFSNSGSRKHFDIYTRCPHNVTFGKSGFPLPHKVISL